MELLFRGCWTVPLLSWLLVLTLVPSSSVHGHSTGTNTTEPSRPTNATDLPNKDDDIITNTVTAAPDTVGTVTQRAGRIPRAGEEEQSSGMFPVGPALEERGVAVPSQLSPDSAETELLLPSVPLKPDMEQGEAGLANTDPPWIREVPVTDPGQLSTAAPPMPSTNPSNPDVFHVDFFDPLSPGRGLDLAAPATPSLAHELQGGDPTSWAVPDNYDYLTPYEDGVSPTADEYTYSTTTDAYESDEDLRVAAASPARSRPRAPGMAVPNIAAVAPPAAVAVDGSDGVGGCRVGFQMVNGSCRSPCNMLPNYCFNGGQCLLLEGSGVLCRCNVQDYIWHKGARCEWVVTEFQVMCAVVGALVVVFLLLFMIIVCFAKKLHLLKTENKKLRKRSSKYRPTSEQHNDNFSLSTIAEGSHPNKTMSRYTWECKTKEESDCEDDPNSQNKLEDPVKAPPKEDDSLNIHNSLTPKHENHKVLGEENSSEVNSLQNNMM
ncbi:chondroitin sulfate proteoglycan 5 isoform 4-T4 [Synchiropus picturatus]